MTISTQDYCVYNETRENLLIPRVSVLDTRSDPLKAVKVLIEGPEPGANAGLWLNPLKSIPAVPRLSAYDLVYLDDEGRVVHGLELAPDDEVPAVAGHAASALLLPLHTFAASQVQAGDRVILQPATEVSAARAAKPIAAKAVEVASAPSVAVVKMQSLLRPAHEPAAVAPDEVVRPAKAKKRFAFLHVITRLRIHIHISIAVEPKAGYGQVHGSTNVVEPAFGAMAWHGRMMSEDDSPGESASLLVRTWRSSRAAYLRWADSFVYRAQSTTRPAHQLGRNFVQFIFPR